MVLENVNYGGYSLNNSIPVIIAFIPFWMSQKSRGNRRLFLTARIRGLKHSTMPAPGQMEKGRLMESLVRLLNISTMDHTPMIKMGEQRTMDIII